MAEKKVMTGDLIAAQAEAAAVKVPKKGKMPAPKIVPVDENDRLPFMVHLKELRNRIMYSVIAVAVTTGIALIFGEQLINVLKFPGRNIDLIAIKLVENMSVYFKVSLAAGIVAAMPVLVYQMFAFVAPGLTSSEKRMIFRLLPGIVIMFMIGVAFAYFVALPPALWFLYTFMSQAATPMPTISDYMSIVTRLLLVIGLVFETPLIVMALARLGVVSPQWLSSRRRLWMVVAFVLAAIITPTFDPINQIIIAVPLILLLEVGIILARMVYKDKRVTPAPAAA
jgi:sec-independent protein translocase protein TatC